MENKEFLDEKYLIRYCGCLLKNLNKGIFEGIVQCPKCRGVIYNVDGVNVYKRKLFYRVPKVEEILKILLTRKTEAQKELWKK
jgi:hypothetical protein